MAASVASTTTRTPKTSAATASNAVTNETEASEIIHGKNNNNREISNNAQKTTLNSQELCRSCGKSSEDLYDLYHQQQQQQQQPNTMASNETKTDDVTPFTTSSTTCYAGKLTSNSSSAHHHNSTNNSCLPTSTTISSSIAATMTFDSVAATAKATAKGQSNMENILQEMQIWHLQVSLLFFYLLLLFLWSFYSLPGELF